VLSYDRTTLVVWALQLGRDLELLCLCCQMCNREVVEKSFAGSIVRSKLLTPHQCCQLVAFMVDQAELLFDVPSNVARIVHARLHSPASMGMQAILHACFLSVIVL